MLQVHQKYENLIAETFKNDPLFLSALDKACASVINSKLSEGIAGAICRSAELVRIIILKFFIISMIQIALNWNVFIGSEILRQFIKKVKINRKRD